MLFFWYIAYELVIKDNLLILHYNRYILRIWFCKNFEYYELIFVTIEKRITCFSLLLLNKYNLFYQKYFIQKLNVTNSTHARQIQNTLFPIFPVIKIIQFSNWIFHIHSNREFHSKRVICTIIIWETHYHAQLQYCLIALYNSIDCHTQLRRANARNPITFCNYCY